MGLVDETEFHYFHFFPYTNLPREPQGAGVALGRLPEQQLRPEARQRALQPVPRRDGAGRQARVRRHRAQRAPQHAVHDEPGAEPHGCGAHPPDEGLGQRVRHSPELRVPEPARRGVRHARRDVGRAAPRRVPARHRHGVLGERGEPGDRAGPLPRVARHHPEVLDRGRPAELRGRLLQLPVPEPVAEADAAAVSRVLHRRHRLARDDRARRRARVRLLGRVHPDRGAAAGCSTSTASGSRPTATR